MQSVHQYQEKLEVADQVKITGRMRSKWWRSLKPGLIIMAVVACTVMLFQNCSSAFGPTDTDGLSKSNTVLPSEIEQLPQAHWQDREDSSTKKAPANSAEQTFDMKKYWPAPAKGTALIRNWTGPDGTPYGYNKVYESSTKGVFLLVETLAGHDGQLTWIDTWNYVIDPSRGVLETGDQFSSGQSIYFKKDGEIIWGNFLNAPKNEKIDYQCQSIITTGNSYVGYQCIGLHSFIPTLEFTVNGQTRSYSDVVKLVVTQQTGVGVQAVYYLAAGLGFVQIDYFDQQWDFIGSWYADKVCMKSVDDWKCD